MLVELEAILPIKTDLGEGSFFAIGGNHVAGISYLVSDSFGSLVSVSVLPSLCRVRFSASSEEF